jgi:hypothetical protein
MDLMLEYFFIRVLGKNRLFILFSLLLSTPCTLHPATLTFSNLEFEVIYLFDFVSPFN